MVRKERSDGIAIVCSPFGETDRVTRNLAPTARSRQQKKRLDFSSRFGRGDAMRKERSDGIAIAGSPFGETDRVTRNLAPTARSRQQKSGSISQAALAGETRFEHATYGFGDRYSTVEPLPCDLKHYSLSSPFRQEIFAGKTKKGRQIYGKTMQTRRHRRWLYGAGDRPRCHRSTLSLS